jgi:hypothetical protein
MNREEIKQKLLNIMKVVQDMNGVILLLFIGTIAVISIFGYNDLYTLVFLAGAVLGAAWTAIIFVSWR